MWTGGKGYREGEVGVLRSVEQGGSSYVHSWPGSALRSERVVPTRAAMSKYHLNLTSRKSTVQKPRQPSLSL